MKNLAKLFVIGIFAFCAAAALIRNVSFPEGARTAFAQTAAKPTPPANTASNSAANTAPANTAANAAPVKPAAGGKTIPKEFTLGKDSVSEYGEVPFNHDNHAFKPYSVDGKSIVGCVECHHTDQPKSAMKPPLVTSERDVVLTLASWQASNQKVSECRFCHFQAGNEPDGKTMPSASYTEGGKTVSKELNNELAYHLNCNTCHDAAAKARPEIIKKAGFATGKDCTICHKPN